METVFRKCRFGNCAFQQCELSLVQVPDGTFSCARSEDSRVIGVNRAEAEWTAAGVGNPIGFFKSTISHSTFIGPSLRRIQIKDCVAVDVDFREANLSEADLAGTDLSNSLFGKTNLSTRQCQSSGYAAMLEAPGMWEGWHGGIDSRG